jgi:hypothetical protein
MNAKTKKVLTEEVVVETPEKNEIDIQTERVKAVRDSLVGAITDILNDTEVGNVLALYDTGVEFDGEEIAKEAAKYVIEGLAQSLCYNVFEGYKTHGARALAKAEDDVSKAAEKDEWSRTEKSADILEGRIQWCAKMDVQQSYRKALQQFASGLYTSISGERYQGHSSANRKPLASPEQGVVARLRARKSAGLSS